ncbi:lipoyl synthase [Candidatus Bipolaricaulota bacterium]|jgi:lipoic acid synthetase|nr:lipoyl synthase [Candidatus Bipolaricaulota bacterium]
MPTHPSWIKVRVPTPTQSAGMAEMRDLLARHHLETVCQGAQCPNAVECWSARTATFMVLGNTCTRGCRFCDVPTGNPGGTVDRQEPQRLASAVGELGLSYVVLTSVDRDDLADGGADAFARVVEAISESAENTTIEVLMPDFVGRRESLDRMMATQANVFGHNLETVRRLSPALRDRRAGYGQSLDVLRYLADRSDGRAIKSGLMVGLGESLDEIRQAMVDLRIAGVTMLTLGQYLQPSTTAVAVERFMPPEEFKILETGAQELGFKAVVAGPLVRSSYHAAAAYTET